MTFQPHQCEDLALKTPAFTEEELLAADRQRAPDQQGEADRAMRAEINHPLSRDS